MKRNAWAAVAFGIALVAAAPRQSEDDKAARAILEKAILAQGGEAELAKIAASTSKLKGTVHAQGMAIAFSGEVSTQGADQARIALELEVENMKFNLTQVFNRDQGWVKFGDDTTEMDKDQLAEVREQTYAGSLTILLPLRDKGFALATVGEAKVEGRPALGIRVSRQGRRDVSLWFDKETHLLVKLETRVKDEESGQEVAEESFLSAHEEKGARQARKISVKRDGKPYVEAEILEIKGEEKLPDTVFSKP